MNQDANKKMYLNNITNENYSYNNNNYKTETNNYPNVT